MPIPSMEKLHAFAKQGNLVFVTNYFPRFRIKPKALGTFSHHVLLRLGFKHTAISFIFVSDSKIKRLNREYLGHDWATDVLAFPYGNSSRGAKRVNHGRSFLGEIIISPMRARLSSKRFDSLFQKEFARYMCHGILHLKGYSDHSVRARAVMEKVEDQLLKTFASKVKRLV